MDFSEMNVGFWIKFLVLWIPFTIMVVIYAPTMKWKLLFPVAGAVGIVLALSGKSMKGVTPLARRGY